MILRSWLQQAVAVLRAAGHEEPGAAVEFLASHRLACGRLDLEFRKDTLLTDTLAGQLKSDLDRLAAGEPLQYVLGETDFLGRIFKVDRRALIPRPETETLTEEVLADEAIWSRPAPVAVDVGTGSGCIAITLARLRPEATVVAVDIRPEALELARENAERHGVGSRIRFQPGDLLEGFAPASLDAAVSNPPYVPTEEWARLPAMIRQYEPRTALDGGIDGLAAISRLVAQAATALKPGGPLYLETAEDHGAAVTALLKQYGFMECEIRSDLCGHERIATGRRP